MPIKKIYKVVFCITFFICSFSALSQENVKKDNSQLTVEADESLEWFEKEKYYLAKGNVVLIKNDLTLEANFVKANYIENKDEIILKNIIAKENVRLTKGRIKATGEYISYDINTEIVTITGPFQTFSSPSGYIESNRIIKFDNIKNKAEADGKVKIILPNKTKIYANNIKADFTGKNKSLNNAIAKGDVIIENTAKGKRSKADLGIYNSSSEIIKLSGNVIIINKESILKGSRGSTNLKTNISNLTGNPSKGKRVKGVFSPIKKKNIGD